MVFRTSTCSNPKSLVHIKMADFWSCALHSKVIPKTTTWDAELTTKLLLVTKKFNEKIANLWKCCIWVFLQRTCSVEIAYSKAQYPEIALQRFACSEILNKMSLSVTRWWGLQIVQLLKINTASCRKNKAMTLEK